MTISPGDSSGVTPDPTSRVVGSDDEAIFRIMANASPVLLWVAATDGLCTFFNQTWLDFTGRTMAEEYGVGWAENVHAEDFERCMTYYVEAFRERRRFEMEYRLRRHDGVYRWILDRGVPRIMPDGEFQGYIGSCVDITERRDREAALQAALEARDEFVSVAGHELGTPLTALRLQLENLTRWTGRAGATVSADDVRARLHSLQTEADRLGALLETLLDVSRVDAGTYPLRLDSVDLQALGQRVVKHLEGVALNAGCQLVWDSGESSERPILARRDSLRLERVLINLLSNAFKYGAGRPVRVHLSSDGEQVSLTVSDQGLGIPPDKLELIFERFERIDPEHKYGGLGLGLWLARRLMDDMGGQLTATSRPGEGSSFLLRLPAQLPPSGSL